MKKKKMMRSKSKGYEATMGREDDMTSRRPKRKTARAR